MDWIRKTTTAPRRNTINWTMWKQLEDLDFKDSIALLSHKHQLMQEKISKLEAMHGLD